MEIEEKRSSAGRKLRNFLLGLALFLLYAYAVQVTSVNLREPLEPQRQENLTGILRALARPDIFAFENETRSTNVSIRMPCPEEIRGSQVTAEDRLVLLAPNCATTTQDVLTLTGEGFQPNVRGIIRWYPPGETTTTRQLAAFRTDASGNLAVRFTMPDIRPTEEPQRIEIEEVVGRRFLGFSEASEVAWERIIETILMALMASTLGTIISFPISFIAARNLMTNVNTTLAALMAALIALPVGGWLAIRLSGWVVDLAAQVTGQTMLGIGTLVLASALTWPVLRLGPPVLSHERQPAGLRVLSTIRILAALLLFLFSLSVLAHLGLILGRWLEAQLGALGFLGNFVYVLADAVRRLLPWLLALGGAGAAASLASRYAEDAVLAWEGLPARLLTTVLTAFGTAALIYGLGAGLNWFYEFENPAAWTTIPAAIGGAVAALASLLIVPKRPIPIGTVIYAVSRGLLNGLRAIEPLILGIVFVVWVGLGPFAGILALMLNSIADLGKLFSEEVENIAEGPLEAITATGANRLQTIIFAVIPQVIPPFIAFTFYRWDINVRISTIIGFVGGGGIGFVLQRNVNLLLYRQASVMVIAIAVVVAVLDYISAKIRSRII